MEASSNPTQDSVDSSPISSSSSTEMGEDHAIDESKTLFLGDLPSSTTAQQIFGLFPEIEVSHVEIKIINSLKGSFCYAFVTFSTAECAQLGVDKYRKSPATLSDGSAISVGWAKRNSRLHVSNLDENTTEKDLIDLFSRFGVLSPYDGILVIKKPSSNPQMYNQTVCYGVIHFEQRDSAENAINDLNNTYFGGRRLRVEWNRGTRKFIGTRQSEDDLSIASCNQPITPVISIYVQFETINSESRVNESLIKELFEPFNNMTGCFIKTNNTSVSGLRQHGYAFVHFRNSFEGTNSALAAASISKDGPYEFKGALLHAEVSKNFRKATLFGRKCSNSNYQYRDDEDPHYGRSFDSFEYHGFSDKRRLNDFIDPQTGPGGDRGTYYYAQPTMPQFMIPFNNSVAYSLPYQSPFIESYSPTSTNSDFIDSQIVYYPAPYSYNILANMKTLPHGIIPLPVQAVQNHAPYGLKTLIRNVDNDSNNNNDDDDDDTRHTLRFYPQSVALLPQPPPPSRPHPGQAYHQNQTHDSHLMIQMPNNVHLLPSRPNSQALPSKVTTLPQSPYQLRISSPFLQQQEQLLQQPQMQHHHQQQLQMQQRSFGSPW